MGPIEKLKTVWNNKLSIEGQNSVKNNSKAIGAAILAGVLVGVVGLPEWAIIATVSAISSIPLRNLTDAEGPVAIDLHNSKNLIEWKNKAGQTIQGSTLQFTKLHQAQEQIGGLFASLSSPPSSAIDKIRNGFRSVASAVRVIQDVPHGDGKFVYAAGQAGLIPAVA